MSDLSPRARIYNLVDAYAKRRTMNVGKVWEKLYVEFEYRTNYAYRRVAHNNGLTALDVIHSLGKIDDCLVVARELLGGVCEIGLQEIWAVLPEPFKEGCFGSVRVGPILVLRQPFQGPYGARKPLSPKELSLFTSGCPGWFHVSIIGNRFNKSLDV